MVNKWSDSHLGFPKFGALPPIGFQGILRRFSNDDSVLEALIGVVFLAALVVSVAIVMVVALVFVV